jgi:hypothetical protein
MPANAQEGSERAFALPPATSKEDEMPEIRTTCLCATAALAIALATGPAVAWEPNKPVEIVVAAGAGDPTRWRE